MNHSARSARCVPTSAIASPEIAGSNHHHGRDQRPAGDRLLEVMHALQHERRLIRRPGQPAAEDVRVADEFALEQVRDLVPLGHHVPRQAPRAGRLRAGPLPASAKSSCSIDPRFVREDVQAVLDRQPASGRSSGLLRPESTTVLPGCSRRKRSSQSGPARRSISQCGRVVGSDVERGDAVDVRDGVAIERAVDVAAPVDAGNHPLLHQRGVEVPRCECDQSNRLHRQRILEVCVQTSMIASRRVDDDQVIQ